MDKPLFCTNRKCIHHKKEHKKLHWWTKFGFYKTILNGYVQRFRCKHCGKTFSVQTYNVNYYVKRIINYKKIMQHLSESMSLSSMSRTLKASVETISNRIERLARQIIVFHEYLKSNIKLKEDLTADGFESFVKSQYFPDNIHLLGGKDSQYLYYLNYVLLKRKGRMTELQKKRIKKLYKKVDFPKGALSKSFCEVVDEVFKLAESTDKYTVFYTDMKPEYKAVFKNHSSYNENKVTHTAIHSKKNRTTSDITFTNEYFDRELRKDQANHRRETTCFSRNISASICRMIVYFFNHNYLKNYRVKNREYNGVSHAEMAGVPKPKIKEVLNVIFRKRVFFSLENVESFARDLWCKKIKTPLKSKKDYVPEYAFM